MQWGGRGIGLLLLLLFAGLALTLETRVELPGLSRLLPAAGGGSELFDAPARRDGPNRQLVREGKVIVPNTSNQPVARVRDVPVHKPSTASPTVEPAGEHSTVTRVQPTATTSTAPPSTEPRVQSSPTQEPSPTARPRNPNAAIPRENPNAQSPNANANATGQAKVKGKGKGEGGNALSPEAAVDSTTP